ncbi:hypothetical protein CDAR_14901 [Caerostris darwini]|uniref:Uncharacterized protein n=1 Tax=Caerostris darwini TaxID=1538125 RepID=A0AAV4W752_9ARAC|nr:hypothetical protein CDAR_14901 [Caerostris darwini]
MIDSIRGKLLSCIFARNYGKGGGWEDGEKHPGLIRLIGKRLYCESGKVKIRTALPPTPSTLPTSPALPSLPVRYEINRKRLGADENFQSPILMGGGGGVVIYWNIPGDRSVSIS